MSSHRGAEPEVKLCRFQSYRQTLQADPWGGPFYGSLGLWELENEKISEKVEAGIQFLEKTGALNNYNDGFSMPRTINYKSLIPHITAKNTITFLMDFLPSRQQFSLISAPFTVKIKVAMTWNYHKQHLDCNIWNKWKLKWWFIFWEIKHPVVCLNPIFFFYSKMDTLSWRVKILSKPVDCHNLLFKSVVRPAHPHRCFRIHLI